METQGKRYNEGKPRMDLLPWDALLELAQHFGLSTKKYPSRNWEKGIKWNEGVGASLARHLAAWSSGEDVDPASEHGAYHDVAILWNAAVMVAYRLRGIGIDDRPKLNSVTNDVPRHSAERDSGYSVTPVTASDQPTSTISASDLPYMVRPDNYRTNAGRTHTAIVAPVTGEVIGWITNP